MAKTKEEIDQTIDENITTNKQGKITGLILNGVLKDMNDKESDNSPIPTEEIERICK